MPKKQNAEIGVKIIKASAPTPAPVVKAETTTQVTTETAYNGSDWITHPIDLRGLKALVRNSNILPQCIRAYKNNIAGFGLGVRYTTDEEETPEMAAEFNRLTEILELLNVEQDTKEVFEDLIEARETYGIAYLEVIRNFAEEVEEVVFVREVPSIDKTIPLEPYIDFTYYHHGEQVTKQKRFCKYRQTIGGKTVYFKEFGDPRTMDLRTGEYVGEEGLDAQYHANEIIEFAIGTEPYGEVRWIGQILGVDGAKRAETLNNNYFINGRHTPLMILIRGGTLTDDSFTKLQTYMEEIRGEAGQHAFIVLETESTDGRVDFDQTEKPDIEVKDLASILQKDELFQDYIDNNRRKVQSSFQLPDIYTGYTTDFNRATSQTAQEITEEQVFQPERRSLAWALNNRLLNAYAFKYVEAYFLEPNISNPDDLYKILTVCNSAGGLTPNKAKEVLYEALGGVAEPYDGDWGDTPLALIRSQNSGAANISGVTMSLEKQIEKAAANHDDSVVAVMREVRDLLKQMEPKEAE